MSRNTLKPFVYWAQTKERISLRVDLTNVKDVAVQIGKNTLDFSSVGHGSQGEKVYSFNLKLFNNIIAEKSEYKVKELGVYFDLKKENEENWWSSLSEKGKKLPWVKVDFDKWKPGSEYETEDEINPSPDLFNDDFFKKMKEDELEDKKVEFRIVYLVLYNTVQFIGYMFIVIVLGIRYMKEGDRACTRAWFYVAGVVKFVQILQLFEIFHRLFKYTVGGILEPFLQTGGRAIVLFVLLDPEPKMHREMSVFYVFMIWSLVEIFRYPFYLLRTCKREFRVLTWLRYTVWLPLYPAGFLTEGIIVSKAIPLLDKSRKFCIDMPNVWNVSFDFPFYLRIYLLFLHFPFMYFMVTYMYKQRNIRLKPRLHQKEE